MIKLVGDALHHDMCGIDVPFIGFCNWKNVAGIFIINTNVTYNYRYNVTYYSLDREQLKTEDKSSTITTPTDTRVRVIKRTKFMFS